MGNYRPAARHGDLVFTAGATPREGKRLVVTGRVGDTVGVEEASSAAALAARRALAAAAEAVGGIDRLGGVVSMTVYIACADGFTTFAPIADAATDAIVEALPTGPPPARAAIGAQCLPDDAPVEVVLVAFAADPEQMP